MSEGRKNQTPTVKAVGTNRESLIGNLTLANNDRNNLTRDTKTFKTNMGLGWSDDYDVIEERDRLIGEAQTYANNTLVDLSQDQLDTLNVRFKQRAQEVLSRNTFQGREQLVLTNRL